MFEELKKTIDKGIEFAFMTKDKIQQSVKEIAKDNNLTKEEAKKLFDQLVKKSEEAKKNLEEKIVEVQKAAITKMSLVTKAEYQVLEDRIKKLEALLKTPAKVNIHADSHKKPVKKSPVRKK